MNGNFKRTVFKSASLETKLKLQNMVADWTFKI